MGIIQKATILMENMYRKGYMETERCGGHGAGKVIDFVGGKPGKMKEI